jgi:hypothetical protein
MPLYRHSAHRLVRLQALRANPALLPNQMEVMPQSRAPYCAPLKYGGGDEKRRDERGTLTGGTGITVLKAPAIRTPRAVRQWLQKTVADCTGTLQLTTVSASASASRQAPHCKDKRFAAMKFWGVTPCGSCNNRRFGGTYRLHHQGDKNR